ncbi:TetR/AcrR family transcriptional regulator [Actinocatenispora rupis]|uniref:TetR family transcriptional regulator n=1 Tax=Actinocatenispora rupis TaxID=519421 RepID=A0A8J3IUR7_9ACTN|nr:TetR/AcrR family transcriptional regulator [Actinocatenispora rupis]GID10286.1 TetR family transcriptional regulator [Actinocatenispora rupis]
MARPRTFDEDRALDTAMRTFWANGYEGTSTRDLCDALNLDRSSVYNAFRSKHELFARALARYIETMNAQQLAILADPDLSAVARIRALFDRIIDTEFEHRRHGRGLGCLTVNSTVELAGRDERVTRMLDRDLAVRLDALRTVIEAGRAAGEVTSGRDADDLARFVNAVIAGMRVAAQGGASRAALTAIAATAVDALTA